MRGDVDKAIATYTDALRDTGLANDRRATILNDRAVANTRLGQTKLALDDYNRAVELFPEYPVAYNNRGNLLLSLGQLSEAIKDFDRALLLAPGYAAAYSNRANAKLKLGKPDDAIADFTKAIELMPASAPPLSGRGLAHLATGKPHAAIRDFSRAVSADARFASAYRNRAEARMDVGQRDEAIEDLSRAIAFDVNNTELYIVRGYAYLLAGNTASAHQGFFARNRARSANRAPPTRDAASPMASPRRRTTLTPISIAPSNSIRARPSRLHFAPIVYKQNGQPDIGRKDVETAIKLDPNSPEALWARGEIAEASGQADTAIADLRRVLQLKPGWQFAADALKRLGAPVDDADDKPQPSLDIDKWHVVAAWQGLFCDQRRLSADPRAARNDRRRTTEAARVGDPERRRTRATGYCGFRAGAFPARAASKIPSLQRLSTSTPASVLAIQPHRQGDARRHVDVGPETICRSQASTA